MVLATDLKDAGIPIEVTDIEEGTLHGTAEGVKLGFLEYRYPDLVPPVVWPEYDVRLAGLEDLACMKLSAIGGRGAKRDFVDIFALGRSGFTVDQMLHLYGRKYGVTDFGHTVFSLTYFDDAEQEDTPEMLWQIEWDDVKRAIERWVLEYTHEQAPPESGGGGIRPS